jgi:hypothetical protein
VYRKCVIVSSKRHSITVVNCSQNAPRVTRCRMGVRSKYTTLSDRYQDPVHEYRQFVGL